MLLIGCSVKPEEKLIGKWQPTQEPELAQILVFLEDGSVQIVGEHPNETEKGRWSITEKGWLKMELPPPNDTTLSELEFSEKAMFLTSKDGETLRFKRVK